MGDMTIKISYTATANGNAMTGQSHVNMGDMPMDIPITGTRQ